MFKKISFFFVFVTLLLVASFSLVHVAIANPTESIKSFASQITVNTDNSVDVIENLTYDTGSTAHHGIYRDIYPYSSEGREMDITVSSVVDETGAPYPYQISNSGKDVRIKIGDPNSTFTGEKIYIITYHATHAVAQLKNVDEIYWNVTGNEWGIPIYKAHASVFLPKGIEVTQSSCYFGPKGVTSQCKSASQGNDLSYDFSAPSTLNPNEGLTIALGFPKGVMTPYIQGEGMSGPLDAYKTWLIALILPLLTLIFSLRYWYKNGRDPKGTGVIIAQYDVPDNLTPMEVAGIVKEKVDVTQISAEIIYLATKGYLKITQLENKALGLFTWKDYELTKFKDSSDLSGHDKNLMNALFSSGETVKLSNLKKTFYRDLLSITNAALDGLLTKGYYKNLGKMKRKAGIVFIAVFVSIWICAIFGGIIGSIVGSLNVAINPMPVILSLISSIIIYSAISYFSPAKTEKGVAIKEYFLGLKEYLQIAEKDRLNFHNAPEKKPEIFEALLPYAMVLGVVTIWAKEFEGIYTAPPSWYSGPIGTNFNSVIFANNISHFSSFTNSALSPSSGGSGGGGFSGGGGGGGGGGSW